MNFTNNLEEAEKVEKLRNKMLKYILYKKRTEEEVRTKFIAEDNNLVEDAIEYFNHTNYKTKAEIMNIYIIEDNS